MKKTKQKHAMSKQIQITQAIGGKDEPNIVYMRKPQRTPQQRTQIIVYFFGHIIVCCKSLIYGF
jgi:hypothetical protein